MPLHLSFHGGVETVTGSCHLLKAGGLNILVDCGLFQGSAKTEKKNFDDFGFDSSSIDYLLITHGHLDHCGRIPVLVKKGFRGKIICTSATYEVAKIVLLDSAKIQEEDYEHWKRIKQRRGQAPGEPLYTTLDAVDSLRYFYPSARYRKSLRLNRNVTATFRDAGHIFGSAFIEIDVKDYGRVVFSGDLGNRDKPIIKDPSLPDARADAIVIESTYSNRNHKNIDDSVDELLHVITGTFNKGGNVLIPSFSIERAQELLFFIRAFHEQGAIPHCRVFLDSPMAIRIVDVMRKNPGYFDKETAKLLKRKGDPFHFPGLKLTRTAEESRKINLFRSNSIIIAGSGMCTGGRIKHHLKHHIWRKESSIIFVGYQARGTLGRHIVDRRRKVRIFGEPYRVNAKIYTIGGFSAHADREILFDWLKGSKGMKHLFLVHGENNTLLTFKKDLMKNKIAKKVHIPSLHQSFLLR